MRVGVLRRVINSCGQFREEVWVIIKDVDAGFLAPLGLAKEPEDWKLIDDSIFYDFAFCLVQASTLLGFVQKEEVIVE